MQMLLLLLLRSLTVSLIIVLGLAPGLVLIDCLPNPADDGLASIALNGVATFAGR